jgi:hypothetical protein
MQMSDVKRNEDGINLDDGQTVFFKGQLEFVKTQTYDQQLGDLKALGGLLPISSSLPKGASELVWRGYKNYGLAKFISDLTTSFPRVDVGGTEQRRYPHEIGLSWGYSVKELQRAYYAGFPLDQKRAAACKRGIEEKLNDIALNGDVKHNIPALLNYPTGSVYAVPATGTGVTKTWSTKTSDQILVDMNGIMNVINNVTMGKEMGNTLLLPKANFDLIRQTRLDATMEKSIYTFFLENNPGLKIDWIKDLDTKGVGSTTRMMAFISDSQHIELEIPTRFEILEEYKEGPRSYVVPAVAETVGVIAYYPLTLVYGDGI